MGFLLAVASCFPETGRLVRGPIIDRQDAAVAVGHAPYASIVVWPKGADCGDAARLHIDADTKVMVRDGAFQRDTNWTILTVGRVVTARIPLDGETSCPVGTVAKFILVDQ